MAEEREDRSREDLTEEASPYRVEEYRRRGMVAQSRELSGVIALLAAGVAAYALSPQMGAQLGDYMRETFRVDLSARFDLGSGHLMHDIFIKALLVLIKAALPVCLVGFVFGILGSFVQIGALFSTEPITPDLTKLNPVQGLQKLLSLKQLVDGLKLVVKVSLVLLVAYLLVKSEVLRSPGLLLGSAEGLVSGYSRAGRAMFFALISVLAVFAGIDYAWQRWEFGKNLRMTKQEAKQEHKEREGDPQIKARIRAVQREMARKRMIQAVKKADVIITNPTHIAIAIVYDREKMAAPKVVAKGADFIAQKIKEVAAAAGVPMVENVPLARTLYKSVKLNQYIPRALYQAVAEVLAYVYRLKRRDF